MKKLYLAGPEVFLQNSVEIGFLKKNICADFGFEGLYPCDNQYDLSEKNIDQKIFRNNLTMIQAADAGIFNLTPFRGASADSGTTFELGFMSALGKPVFGYTNNSADYKDRCDEDGMIIEDFGNSDNLMIDNSFKNTCVIRKQSPISISPAEVFQNIEGFVDCLKEAQIYFSNIFG